MEETVIHKQVDKLAYWNVWQCQSHGERNFDAGLWTILTEGTNYCCPKHILFAWTYCFQKSDWKLHHVECSALSKLEKERLKSLTPSMRLMVKLYMRRKLQSEKVNKFIVHGPNYGVFVFYFLSIWGYYHPKKHIRDD